MPSQRETKSVTTLQRWKGVNQRLQPTLVQANFATWSQGILFGTDDNAERLPGKTLTLLADEAILGMHSFAGVVLVQTLGSLRIIPLTELLATSINLTYVSAGDSNGVCYWLGTRKGTTVWTNPHTANLLVVVKSSFDGGVEADLVDRATDNVSTANLANSFIGVDLGLGRSLRPGNYSIRNRQSFTTESIRNWKLQGCNSVASNSVADWNAATWTDLDTQVANTTITGVNTWGTFPVTLTATSYRYLRILQNGLNSSSSNYLCMGEFEFYGKFTS